MAELKEYAQKLAAGDGDTMPVRTAQPDWMPFVYIVALKYRHAEFLAAVNQIPANYWRHVSRAEDLYDIGSREGAGKVAFYYRWYELQERDKINDYIKAAGDKFVVIELVDEPVTS